MATTAVRHSLASPPAAGLGRLCRRSCLFQREKSDGLVRTRSRTNANAKAYRHRPHQQFRHQSIFSLAAAALRQLPSSSPASSSSQPPGSTGSPGAPLAQQHTSDRSSDGHHTLVTVRTLPYAAADLFGIIADVDVYADFLPHCTHSRVTQWRSAPLPTASKATAAPQPLPAPPQASAWPARADLTVGWGPLVQTYSSRVYCIPSRGVVEAVSGRRGVPSLTADERAEIGLSDASDEADSHLPALATPNTKSDNDPFESLVTRWTVTPLLPLRQQHGNGNGRPAAGMAPPQTRVELQIRFQFQNPLYQIAAGQLGDEMATKMIVAFEKRAKTLLGAHKDGRHSSTPRDAE